MPRKEALEAKNAVEAVTPKRKVGRPRGAKNKKTLLREYELGEVARRFTLTMAKEGQAVIDTVVQKAKEGDMVAAKMVLDRILPLSRQHTPTDGGDIVINIGGLNSAESQIRQASSPQSREPNGTQGDGKEKQPVTIEYSERHPEGPERLN